MRAYREYAHETIQKMLTSISILESSMEEVNNIIETLGGAGISARNILLDSGDKVSTTNYLMKQYSVAEEITASAKYTMVVCANIPSTHQLVVYAGQTSLLSAKVQGTGAEEVYVIQFTTPTNEITDQYIRLYNQLTGSNSNNGLTGTIYWACLYEGYVNVTKDWIPATEDIQSQINSLLSQIEDIHTELGGKVPATRTVNGKALSADIELSKSDIGLGNVENKSSATIRGEMTSANVVNALGYTPLDSTLKGANGGLAELGSDGKVLSSQLPSYVDDVLEYDSLSAFPTTGESGKIYVAKDTSLPYRWSGSAYVVMSSSLALGETSATAYRGDRGKIAYDHSQTAHAPSNAQANQNAFSNVVVGSTTIAADTTTDTLTLVAGDNVTITPDASGDEITFSAKDTVYTHPKSGATAGTYRSVTVDANGHVTGGSNPTLPVTQGGTGATTPAGALANLGLTATATELNYMDGVTANVQTQIDDLKKSVADGKELLATTISEYGYSTVASDATFEEIDTAIDTLASGKESSGYSKGYTNGESNAKNTYMPSGGCRWANVLSDCSVSDVATNGKGTWVAIGVDGVFYSIDDGITWARVSTSFSGTITTWNSVAYDNNIWLMTVATRIYYSTDGITWTASDSIAGYISRPIYYDNDGNWYLLAGSQVTSNYNLYYSTDKGKTWTSAKSSIGTTIPCNGTAYLRDSLSIVNGRLFAHAGGALFMSASTSTALTSFISCGVNNCTSISYANGTFVCGTANGLYYTTGIPNSWTASGITSGAYIKIIYANGLWIALNNYGIIKISSDGITWTSKTHYNGFYDVYYADGVWTALASSSSAVLIANSFDSFYTAFNNSYTYQLNASYIGNIVCCNGTWIIAMGSASSGLGCIFRSNFLYLR